MIPTPLQPWPAGLESGAISPALANEPNASDTGQYTIYKDTAGTFTVGSGVATCAGQFTTMAKTGNDISSGKFLVTCDITARSISGSPAYANSGIGIVKQWTPAGGDVNDVTLEAGYDAVSGTARIAWTMGLSYDFVGGVAFTLTPPYSLALASDGGKRVQMWAKVSGVWRFVTSADISAAFPWGSLTFTGWKPAVIHSVPTAGSSTSFDNLRAAQRFR